MSVREVRSPGVGRVLEVLVSENAKVGMGEEMVVVESMKVEIPVAAPRRGRIASVAVRVGDQVQEGQVLLTLEDEGS